MALWFAFALFLTLGIGVFCLGTAIWAPQSAFSNRLRVLLREPMPQTGDDESPTRIENALESLSNTLPKSPGGLASTTPTHKKGTLGSLGVSAESKSPK